jgi:uncharacterized damage-inducible protein DinB
MNRDDILFLVQYHNRTNKTIFENAALLTEEELRREGEFDKGSAFDALRHLVDVDWSWRQFCNGNDVGKSYLWDLVPMSNFAEVQAAWLKDSHELLVYVEGLNDAALQKEIVINAERDERTPIWKILAHVVNHGTQHRSELARYLTLCGHSPGDLDLL